MKTRKTLYLASWRRSSGAFDACLARGHGQRRGERRRRLVTGANGPEARRLVNRRGRPPSHKIRQLSLRRSRRFLIPDLYQANYSVYSAGYGWSFAQGSSTRTNPQPDRGAAPSAAAAAEYYPA